MSLGLLAVLLAGGSLAVSAAILVVGLRILRNTRRSVRGGEERLEILRTQQEHLKFLREERRLFLEELERRRRKVDELERQREIERAEPQPDAPGPQTSPQRPWWRRVFGG